METAASWKGTLVPPSKYEPQEPMALMNSLGPMIHATRQPGRRKRLVRPSMIRTSVSFSLANLKGATVWASQAVKWNCGLTILVNILNVVSSGNDSAVAVACVVVSAVKFVHDQCGAVAADVLDLGQLRVCQDLAGRVSGVRCQNDTGT